MLGEDVVDQTAQPDLGRRHENQLVTHPFQVTDQVGGHDHGQVGPGHGLGQRGEELLPGQRIQCGHRLIQQQAGGFGQGQRQRELGALAPGQLARRPVQRDAQAPHPGAH